jgi:hypothetical protein
MSKKILKLILLFFSIFFFSFPPFKSSAIDTCDEGWQVQIYHTKQISCHNICKRVTNNCADPIFVPTRTYEEWLQFLVNRPDCIIIDECHNPLWECAKLLTWKLPGCGFGYYWIPTVVGVGPDNMPIIFNQRVAGGGSVTLYICKCSNFSCSCNTSCGPQTQCVEVYSKSFAGLPREIVIGPDNLPVFTFVESTAVGGVSFCKCLNSQCFQKKCFSLSSSLWSSVAVGGDGLARVAFIYIPERMYDPVTIVVGKCVDTNCSSIKYSVRHQYTETPFKLLTGPDNLPVIVFPSRICKCSDDYCSQGLGTCTNINLGGKFSAAIGNDNLPVIAYYEGTNKDLRVCKCSNSLCTSYNCTTVESEGDVGRYPSIAIGPNNLPWIAHYDATNKRLRVCKCQNSNCSSASCYTIATSEQLPTSIYDRFFSLAVGPDNLPVIIYRGERDPLEENINITRICKWNP